MKNKILFIMHTPPPVHGASMMGKYIKDSKVVNKTFECKYINLTTASSITDIGKVGLKKVFRFVSLLNRIWKGIKQFEPDLVYITPNTKGGAFIKDFITMAMIKCLHKNIVIHFHNKGVRKYQDKAVFDFLYKRFFKGVKVILLAEPLYDDICKYVSRDNVVFCANGIPAMVQYTQKELTPKGKKLEILFLSNMMREKGVWTLLEACKMLAENGYGFHCGFVGKWSDITENEFNEKAKAYGITNSVTAYGAKYGEEKNIFFEKADLFILPTYDDCFPLTLLEAMEYGLPCIASDEGGISGIIDNGINGYVIEKKNPVLLYEKIAYLCDNRDVLNSFGIKSREKFENEYSLEKFEKNITNILRKSVC